MQKLAIVHSALLLCLAGCSLDVVVHDYDTLAEARRDRLFDKGWLPDILPPSSHSITTANNLDVNTSSGHFEFSDTDAAPFFRKLEQGAPDGAPVEDWRELRRQYEATGYEAWRYAKGGHTWVFFCHPRRDKCHYRLW